MTYKLLLNFVQFCYCCFQKSGTCHPPTIEFPAIPTLSLKFQMTSLLHHQYQLNEQIRDLTHPSATDALGSRCHDNASCLHSNEACFHSNILKRVQDLENQVRRNAKELEDMKRRLEDKLIL